MVKYARFLMKCSETARLVYAVTILVYSMSVSRSMVGGFMFLRHSGKAVVAVLGEAFIFIFLGRGDTLIGRFERGIMNDPYKTRQTLIQRVKESQDERSWEEFISTYQPYIKAIVRNMNIVEHDAEDIVQQVMLKVWKNIGELENDPNKRFRSWLGTTTANCVRDFIRKRRSDMARLEKASRDETLSYIDSIRLPEIDRIAEQRWGVHIFNLALDRIEGLFSGKAIQVFLFSLEGLSVEEIARKLKLKENSVYRLKNRVKERLALEIKHLREELE